MTIHTRRKRRTQRGGLVPGFTSLKVKFFGEDSLTRVKEIAITTNENGIKVCEEITEKNNPILFAIRKNMENIQKFKNAGEYYFPQKDDTAEMKVAKCKRLNELRSKWIEIKKNEMNTGNKTMSDYDVFEPSKYDYTIVDKNMLGKVTTTRYFDYLMREYCILATANLSPSDYQTCINYIGVPVYTKNAEEDNNTKVEVGGKNSSKKRQMYKRTRKARLNGTRFKSRKSRRNNRSKRHTRKRSHA